jgi:hypothetical protein
VVGSGYSVERVGKITIASINLKAGRSLRLSVKG